MRPQGVEHAGVHVEAVGRNLIGIDREKGLAFADRTTLLDVNGLDRPSLRGEDFGCACGGCEIADCCLFAGVLCDECERE